MMCGLGRHQAGQDVRPKRRRRRHLDGSVTEAVGHTPAKELEANRARLHTDLRHDVGSDRPDSKYATDVDWSKFEPVPPHEQLALDMHDRGDADKRARRQQRARSFLATGDLD